MLGKQEAAKKFGGSFAPETCRAFFEPYPDAKVLPVAPDFRPLIQLCPSASTEQTNFPSPAVYYAI
jgi:hypothetical protein